MGWSVTLTHLLSACLCQNRFLQQTPTKAEESGGAYASLGTRQEGRRFEDVGLSICASPLRIVTDRFSFSFSYLICD